ncbi:MAG: electron transfer flavoprotein subunit alpha/FixB family protein [Actinomycetales bacterium]
MTLVLVEQTNAGVLVDVSDEALTFARSLAPGGADGEAGIDAVVVGQPAPSLVQELAGYGVRKVHVLTGEAFDAYAGAAWAAGVDSVLSASGSAVVMAAGTPRGNEVMAHLAARRRVAMAANVVALDSAQPLTVTRQVVGGAALEEMRLTDDPAILTVAGHALEASPAPAPGPAQVVVEQPSVAEQDLLARVVSVSDPEPDMSGSLKSARVVVGAGRGAGGQNGFDDLLELTELLGGALGVSRVVTSLGWRPHHEQVGQTGSKISPQIYIACGISGAIQHWVGCSSAQTILAINTDADAPMVTKAHYAVIGDLHEVVPAINAEIRRRQA